MKRLFILLLGCTFIFMFSGCKSTHLEDPSTYSEIDETPEVSSAVESVPKKVDMEVDGAELLAGEWTCIATYYDNNLVLFKDVPALADLYDQTLAFNADGTYTIYDVPYGEKGRWYKEDHQAFSDFEQAFLVMKEYTTSGKLVDGKVTFTEKESTGTAIVCMQDNNPDNLIWLESDDEGVDVFVYGRNGADCSYSFSGKSNNNTFSSYSTGTLLERAESYLNSSAFSYDGLVDQLEYEGFSHSEAVYGADNCGADWNEQALKKALRYLEHSAFSESGLIEQLEYEGFTASQAEYGVSRCGADWNEQAVKKAASYLSHSSFSRSDLIDQLEFEGFTHAQAVYGVTQNGY